MHLSAGIQPCSFVPTPVFCSLRSYDGVSHLLSHAPQSVLKSKSSNRWNVGSTALKMRQRSEIGDSTAGQSKPGNFLLRGLLAVGAMSIMLSCSAAEASPVYVAWAKVPPKYIHRPAGRLHRWDAEDSKRDWYNKHESLFEPGQAGPSEKFVRDRQFQRKAPEGYAAEKYVPVVASLFCGLMVFTVGSVLTSERNYDPFGRAPWD